MTAASLVKKYEELLDALAQRFQLIRTKYSHQISCGQGCARCCLGLFDVSLPDALRIARAFAALPPRIQSDVTARSLALQSRLLQKEPELPEPYFLNTISQDRIDQLVECIPEARCPFLDAQDQCLIYCQRPLACHLEGLPMVDVRDGLFDDWCELNFKDGISSELREDLRLDYYGIQETEREIAESLSQDLFGSRREDLTVMIPTVIASFNRFWKPLLVHLQERS